MMSQSFTKIAMLNVCQDNADKAVTARIAPLPELLLGQYTIQLGTFQSHTRSRLSPSDLYKHCLPDQRLCGTKSK